MGRTTIETDPEGAASYLRSLKLPREEEYHPDQEQDWITRSSAEVRKKLERDSLWENPSPVGRGRDYETLVGVNIGGNHPVIDDVTISEGIVTSMKTMDTHNPFYQDDAGIKATVGKYIDAFEHFTGVHSSEYNLPIDQIKAYHLEIAVRTDLSSLQRQTFGRLQEYGHAKGVRVIIVEVA